ncbi:MAG: hypothetical protein IKE63_06950 [Bacilli bacterium]|nr:hypothetical protein [Bacilli bacterium]
MKKIYSLIIVMIIIGGLIMFTKDKKEISTIKKLEYSYTSGMTINGYSRYIVECNDKCTALIKPTNIAEENTKKVELNDEIMNQLEKLLKKYKVNKWNGFNKHDPNVLDGRSFNIYIEMKNGDSISASGYMKWPENFGEVSKELDNIFEKLYDDK